MANKILFQFENFSEYSHAEVRKIVDEVINRENECQNKLYELRDLLDKFQIGVDDFKMTSKNLQSISVEVQMLQSSCDIVSSSSFNNHSPSINESQ